MKANAAWVEYWLHPVTNVNKEVLEISKERIKNNLAKNITISRAMLAFQVAQIRDFRVFLRRFPIHLPEEEMKEIDLQIKAIEKRIAAMAYKEVARQSGDLAIAMVAGMRKFCNEDFVDLAAQSLFYYLYRLSPYSSNGSVNPLAPWSSAFTRISFEATSTGPSNQKNKIVSWSLEQCDKFWKNAHGCKEIVYIHEQATEHGLDITDCIWSIANLCKQAFAKLATFEPHALTRADHSKVDRMFQQGGL
jgi:hypothetical protein